MANPRSDLEVRVLARDELSPQLQKIESKVIRVVGAISASLAAIKIGTAPIRAAASFEREMANVAKTTDFARGVFGKTVGDLDKLGSALLEMSLRVDVAATDLAKIAAAAGQQGLGRFGVQGIIAFTDSVSRMASVLDITAEEAADNTGKIINIFKTPLKEIERAVSTFNEVSNNSTASGKDLLDVVRRIGDAAGALDLTKATALAATGLDFGQSPEVVGTAYARIFSAMFEKADQFAALMKVPVTEFIRGLKTDGLKAYTDFLAAARKLSEQDQQKAIVKLIGGGRIGSLVNKQIQDTTNSVLLRNLQSARDGQLGISALKEQATVLNTLEAQVKILGNSFFKLGTEASQQLLGPLTQYAAQLSEALQSDKVKSFIGAVMASIGDFVRRIAEAVKWVADLNVNWENFIRVVQIFLGLKLAESFTGIIGRFGGFASSLKLIATAVKGTADAVVVAEARAAVAAKGGIAASILAVKEYIEKLKARKAAEEAAMLASQQLDAAQRKSAAAQAASGVANQALGVADTRVNLTGRAAQAARAAVTQAEARAAAAAQAVQQAQAARATAAAQQHNAAMLQIEQAYQTRRAAIKATGTEVGLKAARAERATQLADEQAHHQRSLQGINNYYARRLAAVEAAGRVEIANERNLLMQRLAVFDGAVNAQAARTNAAALAGAAAAAATAGVAAATTKLTLMQQAANVASLALGGLMGVARATGAALLFLGKAFGVIFFWATLAYQIADMTGLLDKLPSILQTITDKLGFTSAAKRDAAIAAEALRKKEKELTSELQAQTKAYRDNQDAASGKQNLVRARSFVVQAAQTEDPSIRAKAIGEFADIARGAQLVAGEASQRRTAETQALIAAQEKVIDEAKVRIKAKMDQLNAALKFNPEFAKRKGGLAETITSEVQAANTVIGDAEKIIQRYRASLTFTGADASKAKEGLAELAKVAGSMFTPESLQAVQDFVVPVVQVQEEFLRLQNEYSKASQEEIRTGKAAGESSAVIGVAISEASSRLDQARDKLTKFVQDAPKLKLSKEVLESFQSLDQFLNTSSANLLALIATAKLASKEDLNATNLIKPNPKSSGTNTFTPQKESLARRLARARLARERAEIQAENALSDEQSRQLLDREQDAYDRGLIAIADYYEKRRKLQQDAITRDIEDKRREIQAVEFEVKGTKDPVELIKFDTQRKQLEGQIKVLQARRKAIDATATEDSRKASDEFVKRVLSETANLYDQGIIPAQARDVFELNLLEMEKAHEQWINQLRKNGEGKLADAIQGGFNVEAFKRSLVPVTRAVDDVFTALSNTQARLEIARVDGARTSQEAEATYTAAVKEQLPVLEAKLQIMLAELENLKATQKVSDEELARRAAAIDQVRIRMEQLRQTANQTARELNNAMTSSLQSGIESVLNATTSLRDAIRNVLREITSSVQRVFAKDLAERIQRGLGNVGEKGFGGFFQGILQPGGGERGASPNNPVYVATKAGENPVTAGADSVFDTIKEKMNDVLSGMGSFFKDIFGDLPDTIGSVFKGLFSGFGGNSLGGGFGSGFFGLLSSVFLHSGGVVGKHGTKRLMHPAIFANAKRYHEGSLKLKSNEVPAILQKSERVLTENQSKQVDAALAGSQREVAIRNVLVTDPSFIQDAMSSAQGEKVVLNILQKNKASIRQMVS